MTELIVCWMLRCVGVFFAFMFADALVYPEASDPSAWRDYLELWFLSFIMFLVIGDRYLAERRSAPEQREAGEP